MDMRVGGMKMSYDTENPPEDGEDNLFLAMLAPAFQKIVGHKIHFELDTNNQVTAVSGSEEFGKKLLGALNPQMAQMLKGMFNMDAEATSLDVLLFPTYLPPHPVKLGDSWSANVDPAHLQVPPGNEVFLDLQCQFESKEMRDGRETISIPFSGLIVIAPQSNPESNDANFMGMEMKITEGKMFGRQWYAPDIGQIVDSNTQMNKKMTVKLPSIPGLSPNRSAENQEMEAAMISRTEINHKLIAIEPIEPPAPDTEQNESAQQSQPETSSQNGSPSD